MAAVVLGLAVGCAGSRAATSTGSACAGARVGSQAAVDALAGCTELRGDLIIASGASLDLSALGRLERVTGAVRVGPSLVLSIVAGPGRLAQIGGDLVIDANGTATGAFLPALTEVGGDMLVAGNPALATLSMPALRRVRGSLQVRGNPALELLDLASLAEVGGQLVLAGNRRLATVTAAAPVAVGGVVTVRDSPGIAPADLVASPAPAPTSAGPPESGAGAPD